MLQVADVAVQTRLVSTGLYGLRCILRFALLIGQCFTLRNDLSRSFVAFI